MDEAKEVEVRLEISNVNDESFPDLSNRDEITELNFIGNPDLTIISSLPPNLEDLAIFYGENLVQISTELPISLQSFHIEDCPSFREIPFLKANVRELSMNGCASLETIINLPENLKDLYIDTCPLVVLPPLPRSLKRLTCEVSQLISWRRSKDFLESFDYLLGQPDFMVSIPGNYENDIEKERIINELQQADTDEVLIVASNTAMKPGRAVARVLNDPSIADKLLPYLNDNSTNVNADLIQSQTELGQTIAASRQGSASASNLKVEGGKSKKQRRGKKSKKSRKSKRRRHKYTKKRRRTSRK